MKKKFGIILLALTLCAMAAFVTACGGNKTGEKSDYDWKYEKEFVDEHDADMTIDGDLSEARWQGQQYLTHVQDGVTVNYTTVFTEKGLYIGAKAQDPDMKWNARFNFSGTNQNPANSAFWFNIKGADVQDGHAMRAFNFFVDAFDSASRNQTRFEAKSKVNGDIMKFEATEMTAELFVSWDALNIDTTDGLPEFVRIIPYYRHVKNVADAGENKWITPIFIYGNPGWDYGLSYDENLRQNWYRPIAGMKFGSVGYINADKPGAVVGDAANGYSKSSGWDLSRIDDGVAKATGPDEQAIFFKGINSSKYMVSAKMKMLGGATHAGNWKDQYPSAGLISMRDETESIAFYVHGRSILDGAASWNFHTLDKYTGWKDVGEGSYAKPEGFNPATDQIELKCIQYDENLFYFINGSLVLIKRVDWIKDGACPGLYGLSAEVEFSDFQAADYADNADALKAIISEYAYNVSVTAGDGGFVTVDKTALRKGDSLTVTVTPNAGFVLSSFTVSGVDRYDYVVNNLAAGKVTFADIEADSAIEATFARLSGGVRVTGKITAEGRAVTTSLLTLTSPADKRVFYTAAPTSNGSFNFTLSPAGTYTVGEKTITLDGNYVLNIKTAGYRDRTIEITVNADDKSVRVPDVELEKNVVGGSVTIGGRTFDSSVNNWDMSGEADSVIYAENGSNGSLAYFTEKTGKDAVIDFTISNKTEITEDGKYETEPCMGVSLTDGSNRFEIFVLNEGLRISPKGWWDGGGEAYNVSVPVSYSLRAKANPETLTFRLVRSGAVVAMLFKNGDDYVEIWRTRNATIEKMSAYAFTVCQSQPCRLEFSNYSIKLGDEAKDYIEAALYETVTLGEYDTTKGTATIVGATNGKIKYGDKLTVTIDSDKTAIVTYGDKAEIIAGGGEVSFTATHSGEVTVSFADSLVAVTGSVELGENLDGLTIDYTKTELEFTGEGYTLTYSGIVKADGTFTVDLPSGAYTVVATNPAAYAKATVITISDENKTAAVVFTLVKPSNAENLTFDAASGELTNDKDIVAYFGSGNDFVVTTYIDRITTDWKAAGVALGGANTDMRILIRKTNDAAGACDVFVHVGGGYIELPRMSDPFAAGDKAKLTVVRRGASVKIFVNDSYYGRIEIADGTAVKHWGTPDTKLTDHLGADEELRFGLSTSDSTNATFSDWGYGLKFDDLSDGITAKVGGTAVADGKVILGDTVTVTVESADKIALLVDGVTLDATITDGVYTASFVVTGNHAVTIAEVRAVGGTVTRNDIYSSDASKDITATTIKAYKGGELVGTFEGKVGADGAYSIGLIDGEYTLEFENPYFMTVSKPVTVSGGAATVGEAAFTLAKIDGGWGDWIYDEANERVTLPANVDSAFKTFAGVEGGRVLATMTVSNIDTRYDGWASAGIRIETQSGGIMYFSLTETVNKAGENGAVKIRILRFDTWEYVTEFGVSETDADYTAAKLTVCVSDNAVYLYVNDTLRYTISATQNTAVYEKLKSIGFFADNANYKPSLSVVKPGENVTVSAFDATADGAIIDKFLERTLTLPEGVTAKVGETEITNGKVLLGDTVTVSVESANLVTFSVDGTAITTAANGGTYSASFVIAGNHTVTYEESYAIGGAVTSEVDGVSADGAAVKVLDESGATVTDCTADADGKFTFVVRNGVYKVYALVDGKAASLAYTVKIANGAITEVNGESVTALNIALTKRLASSALGYDPNTGALTGQDRTAGYLYGAEVNAGEPFVLTATVKRQEVMWWPAIGLIIGAGGDNYVQFAIRKCCPDTGVYYDFMMRRQSNADTGAGELYAGREFGEALRADAFGSDDTVKLTIAYYGGNYFVYMDDALTLTIPETTSMYGTPLKDVIGTCKLKLGLFAEQTGTFTEWGYEIGKTAVAKLIGRTLTLPEGVTAKVGDTEVVDGKVLLGDTVTVSMMSANLVTFAIDGVTVTTDRNENVYSASFVVTDNHAVTYEEAYAVSGKIAKPDYATADLTSTVLKFIKDGVATEFTGVVGISGEYSVYLPAGEYTVRAEHAAFMPAIGDTIAVTNAAVENANATFTLVRPDMSGLTFDESTGKITNSGDITAYFGSGTDFAVTTYVDKITTDWKGAGIVVRDATKTNFIKITLRKITGGYDLYANFGDGYISFSAFDRSPFVLDGERAKLTVVRMAASLSTLRVYVNDKHFTNIQVEDATVVKHWGTADTKLTDYLSPDGEYSFGLGTCDNTNATFSDWDYVTGNERKLVLSDGITAKVGDTPVTNGKVSLGDLVVVSKVSDVPVMIAANGIYQNTTVSGTTYTAQFYASSHKVVTASPYYAVGGTVMKTSAYGADSAKSVAATVIKAYNGGNLIKTFENKVNADGTYSIELPAGAWVLDFENASFMTVTNFIEVKGNASNVSNVKFGLAKIADGWTYNRDEQSVTPGAAENNVWKIFSGSAGSAQLLSTVTVANLITTNDVWASTGIYVSSSAQSTKHVYFALGEYVGTAGDKGAIKIRILCDPWLDMGLVVATETDVDYEKATLAVCVTEASVRLYLNGNLAYTISATENADKYATLRDTYGFFTSGATYTSGIKVVKQGGVPITAFDWTNDTAIISALG